MVRKNSFEVISRAFIVAVIFVFFVSAVLGAKISMIHDGQGAMTNCPLMSYNPSMCPMGALEHMAYWQMLFSARPEFGLMLILLLFLFTLFLIRAYVTGPPKRSSPYRYFQSRDPNARLFHYLLPAFADGILHPKRDA